MEPATVLRSRGPGADRGGARSRIETAEKTAQIGRASSAVIMNMGTKVDRGGGIAAIVPMMPALARESTHAVRKLSIIKTDNRE